MKKYIIIILLLLLMPIVMASLEVDDVRGYINNERVLDINENGGDFDVEGGDSIDLVVRIKNIANITIQAKLVGTIKDIDDNADITKTQDFFDVEANNDRSKTLSFLIPVDARRDEYELELKVINSSNDSIKIVEYNVIVETYVSDDTSNINEISDAIGNLTASCNLIAETTNICFNYIGIANNCTNELSTVKEERGTYKTQSDECSQTKAELERQRVQLENDKSNMISTMMSIAQCNNQTATAVIATRNESDDKFNQTLLIIGGGGLIYWYYTKRKKEKSSTASSYESDYFSKS